MISLEVEITPDLYQQLKQLLSANSSLDQDSVISSALSVYLDQLENVRNRTAS